MLPQPTVSDQLNYDRHWAALAANDAETAVPRAAAEAHLGHLLEGEALTALLTHVAGEDAELVTREQFVAACHLVYAVLRQAQENMFAADADALFSASPPPVVHPHVAGAKKKAVKHIRCDSLATGGSWTIAAASEAGPLEAGATGSQAGAVPLQLLSPSLLAQRPLERGASAMEQQLSAAAAEEGAQLHGGGGGRQAAPSGAASLRSSYHTAEDTSEFELRLAGLMQQLDETRAAVAADDVAPASPEATARRERLMVLEAQVQHERQLQQQQQQTAEGASWQAFGIDSPGEAAASLQPVGPASELFASVSFPSASKQAHAAVASAASGDVWDAFAQERSRHSVPETPQAKLPQPSPFHDLNHEALESSLQQLQWEQQAPGSGSGFVQFAAGLAHPPPSPGVAPPAGGVAAAAMRNISTSQQIIGTMLDALRLSPQPQVQPLRPALSAAANSSAEAAPACGPTHKAELQPMSVADREAAEAEFTKRGYAVLGGMDAATAQEMFSRAALPPQLFPHAFMLADADRDGRLSAPEFCVFVQLLHLTRKGRPLPLSLSWQQFSALLGPPAKLRVDASKLRGALHRPNGSHAGSRLGSEVGEAALTHGSCHLKEGASESEADSDDDFESMTTLSVGSSFRSRRTAASAVHGQPAGRGGSSSTVATALAHERVRAWAGNDPSHNALELTVRSVGRIAYTKPLEKPFFSVSARPWSCCFFLAEQLCMVLVCSLLPQHSIIFWPSSIAMLHRCATARAG